MGDLGGNGGGGVEVRVGTVGSFSFSSSCDGSLRGLKLYGLGGGGVGDFGTGILFSVCSCSVLVDSVSTGESISILTSSVFLLGSGVALSVPI